MKQRWSPGNRHTAGSGAPLSDLHIQEKNLGKSLFIAEKPSVAQQFAQVLKVSGRQGAGYLENADYVVTWCVGHLVSMSYPEAYDEKYKKWSLETLPFLPKEYRYEVIKDVQKQFDIVKGLLNRPDVSTIYVCTDSGREGEYIYRLVAQMAGVKDKAQKRVWIDSQTEEEIRRGIDEAKDLSAYDNLSASAYLRAREDYLMGINFSRLLTLAYGGYIKSALSLEDVADIFRLRKESYSTEEAYTYFSKRFEAVMNDNEAPKKVEDDLLKGLLEKIISTIVSNIRLHDLLAKSFGNEIKK